MPPIEVFRLITDGGSAVAIVVVVVLFLNFLQRGFGLVQTITTGFSAEIAAMRDSFQSQITSLSDSHADLSRETIRAFGDLKTAVRDLMSERTEDRATVAQNRRADAADRKAVADRLTAGDAKRAEDLNDKHNAE